MDIRFRQFRGLQALHFFLAGHHLAGTRAAGEARDEFLQLLDLFFALRVAGFNAGADLRLGEHHIVIAAGVGDDGFVIDIRHVGADAVQEMTVVRNRDQHAGVAAEIILQPVDRFEVEVVGGLVE